jgi:hypothetical protein
MSPQSNEAVTEAGGANLGVDQRPHTPEEYACRAALAETGLLVEVDQFRSHLRLLPMARSVWQSLNHEDRDGLGTDLWSVYHACGGALGMWMQHCPHDNRYRGLLELAEEHGYFSKATMRQFRQAIDSADPGNASIPPSGSKIVTRPRWDAVDGRLYYGEQCARVIRVYKSKSSLHRIVGAFEEAGWSRSIPCLSAELEADDRSRKLNELNKRLKFIRFHAGHEGEVPTIYWAKLES